MPIPPKKPATDPAPELDAASLAAIREVLDLAGEPPEPAAPGASAEQAQALPTAPGSSISKSDPAPDLKLKPQISTSAEPTLAEPGHGRPATRRAPHAPPDASLLFLQDAKHAKNEPARKKPKADVGTDGNAGKKRLFRRLTSRVSAFRPSPLLVVAGCAIVLVLFRPWLVAGVVFFAVLLMLAVFLILGYDGFWRRAMAAARWYARRRPARSAELHRRLDRFAMKWDAVLDRFPEGTVDALYLPDFGALAEADARHDAALDRRFEGLRGGDA